MRETIVIIFVIIIISILSVIQSCSKVKSDQNNDFRNQNASIEVQRCWCDPSVYRYLVAIEYNNTKTYYNPVNLSNSYMDNYKIVFSGVLLEDSTSVYSNLPNDAVYVAFKARNIQLTYIRKIQ
jgi:predicted transcriptional regulator